MHFSNFSILQWAIPWRPQPARAPAGSTWPFKTYMPLKVCVCMLLPNFKLVSFYCCLAFQTAIQLHTITTRE